MELLKVLEKILTSLVNLGNVEVEFNLKESIFVNNINKRLEKKIRRVRKDISKLERKIIRKSCKRKPIYSIPRADVADYSTWRNYGKASIRKPALSDSKIEISLIPL